MRNLRVLCIALAACVALALAVPVHALAFEQRPGSYVVVSEPVSDDLFLFGTNIEVSAPVDGDVFAFGQNISISGDVSGTVVASGQSVRVSGDVARSVRAAGQDVEISGAVLEDLMAAGATVRLTQEGSVGRDAAVAGQTVGLAGDVGRNVLASAQSVTIAASVGGDLRVEASDLTVTDTAHISGDLDYTTTQEPNVQGQVSGTTTRHEPQRNVQRERTNPAVGAFLGILGWIRSLIGIVLLGIAVVLLSRSRLTHVSDALSTRPWPSLGIGLAVLFGLWPVAMIVFLVGLLIGGWWIAFVLVTAVWLLALVGLIVGGLTLGRLLLGWMHAQELHPLLATALGLVVIWVIGIVPFVGWLAGFAAIAFGTGAITLVLFGRPPRSDLPGGSVYASVPQPSYAPPSTPSYAPPYTPPPPPSGSV